MDLDRGVVQCARDTAAMENSQEPVRGMCAHARPEQGDNLAGVQVASGERQTGLVLVVWR